MPTKQKPIPVAALPAPKPQIPTALAALRRVVATLQTGVALLESRLEPVMRPGEVRTDGAKNLISSTAPVAETVTDAVAQLASLNARLKDVTARLEV